MTTLWKVHDGEGPIRSGMSREVELSNPASMITKTYSIRKRRVTVAKKSQANMPWAGNRVSASTEGPYTSDVGLFKGVNQVYGIIADDTAEVPTPDKSPRPSTPAIAPTPTHCDFDGTGVTGISSFGNGK